MIESIWKLRELAADMNANEIIDHIQLYPSCVFKGEWLDAWHRSFDKELEALEREIAEKYMELPVDADGVPWHIGDMTENGNVVNGISFDRHGAHFVSTLNDINPSIHTHFKPRTIEDVLEEFYHAVLNHDMDNTRLEKYADELRGMGVDE